MNRSFDEKLALFAKLAVHEGLGLARGQELLVVAELVAAPLVRVIAAEAYRAAGAKNVEVLWSDPELTLARFRAGSDEAIACAPSWLIDGVARAHRENAARLAIASTDPGLLANVAPDRVATQSKVQAAARKPVADLVAGCAINWCVIGAASPAWAARVFPDLPTDRALAKLWDAIFLTSRVDEADPVAAWVAHSESLEARVTTLDAARFDTSPGPARTCASGSSRGTRGPAGAGGRGTGSFGRPTSRRRRSSACRTGFASTASCRARCR
jgi:aminopeptidase